MEFFEDLLKCIVIPLHFIMEAISAFCIVMSLLISIQNAKHDFQEIPNRGFKWLARFTSNSFQVALTSKIRLTLGLWLALALDFQLAADILETIYVANISQVLIKLVVISIVRVFFSYYLHREVEKWK
jgi:uncharacterized membrane protein